MGSAFFIPVMVSESQSTSSTAAKPNQHDGASSHRGLKPMQEILRAGPCKLGEKERERTTGKTRFL